jgi:hypothetical protein
VDKIQGNVPKIEWDFEGIHYFDNGPLTVQYLFVLDALNFCFWPGISSTSNAVSVLNIYKLTECFMVSYMATS